MAIKNLMGYPVDYVAELISVVREQHRKFPEYEKVIPTSNDKYMDKSKSVYKRK